MYFLKTKFGCIISFCSEAPPYSISNKPPVLFEVLFTMNSKRDMSTRGKKTDESEITNDEMTISQLAHRISKELESTKTAITKQINDGMLAVKTELKADLETIRSQLEATISEISTSVSQNKESLRSTSEALTRSFNVSDLIVSGVPYMRNENLLDYFDTWCKSLGYTNTPLVDARRLSKLPMTVGKKYLILLQFAITNQRGDFYNCYLKTRSLTLDQIGFKTKDRIYVNENLTASARVIKTKAVAARKEGKLHSVFSRDGVIFVRKTATDVVRSVESEEQLICLLQQC